MNKTYYNKLINDCVNAIFFLEDKDAKQLIKKVEEFIEQEKLESVNPELHKKLQKLVIQLKIVAFPNLKDEESEEILRRHYLESFDIDVSMENRLIGKLFFVPFAARDELREKLKKALRENQQQIGNLSISQWIDAFEKEFNVKTRSLSASVDFVNKNELARQLNSTDRRKLEKMLHAYDYLLVTTLPATEPELSQILASVDSTPSQESSSREDLQRKINTSLGNFNPKDQESLQKISLKEAIKKYPKIENQIITSQKLKLKNFPTPVHPTIKNWLSDYTFNLGYEKHNSVQRGQYIFQSENGRKLNQNDQKRLSLVLKSLDEDMLLTVDIKNQKIIFNSVIQTKNQIKEKFSPKKERSNVQNTQFDFKQKMPYEKEQKTPEKELPPHRIVPPNLRSNSNRNILEKNNNQENKAKNLVNLKK